jgi:hypothetical protein
MGSDPHENHSLVDRLAHATEIRMLEIPKASVDDLVAIGRRGVTEIPSLHKGDRKAAQGRIPCSTDPVDPPTNDEEIVFLLD